MSPQSWEKALTDAYWDYRWHKILEPLCDTFQGWKAGKLSYQEVDEAIDNAYKKKNLINSLLTYRPDRAAAYSDENDHVFRPCRPPVGAKRR